MPAEELYAPVGEDHGVDGVNVGDVPNVDGAEAELPTEELYAPVGEDRSAGGVNVGDVPNADDNGGVNLVGDDEGLEIELEGVGLDEPLPGHVMVLLAAAEGWGRC